MSGEEVLIQSPSLYRLVRAPDGTLTLEVVVGAIAMDEVRVRLTEEEAASYAREGRGRPPPPRHASRRGMCPSRWGRAARAL